MKKNEKRDERKSRKILVPLATLTVAAAVAVGSGATWTSSSKITASVTAGHLVTTNSNDNGTLKIEHLKPGATASGVVTLKEGDNNDVDGLLKVVASNMTDGFTGADLLINITPSTGTGGTGGFVNFRSLGGANKSLDLGALNDGFGSATVTIDVQLAQSAGIEDEGAEAGVDLQFVTTSTVDNNNATVTWVPAPPPVTP